MEGCGVFAVELNVAGVDGCVMARLLFAVVVLLGSRGVGLCAV
jgi:hypothetical protein